MKHNNEIATDRLLEVWAREGQIIESGWRAFAATNLSDASVGQLQEMRKAWMLGAQHLYAILAHVADSDQKVKIVEMIASEIKAFQRSYLERSLQ